MTAERRPVQRSRTGLVSGVNIGVRSQKRFHERPVAISAGGVNGVPLLPDVAIAGSLAFRNLRTFKTFHHNAKAKIEIERRYMLLDLLSESTSHMRMTAAGMPTKARRTIPLATHA